MPTKQKTLNLVHGAIIAALYTALTYAAAAIGLAYGPFQFRFSEALTILPVFTPAAIPGLTIGCFLGNLGNIGSPFGPIDLVAGTLASLLAAILTRASRKVELFRIPILAPLPPVIINAVIIGLEIMIFFTKDISLFGFWSAAVSVGFGQLVVCYGLGLPLWAAIRKTRLFEKFRFRV